MHSHKIVDPDNDRRSTVSTFLNYLNYLNDLSLYKRIRFVCFYPKVSTLETFDDFFLTYSYPFY